MRGSRGWREDPGFGDCEYGYLHLPHGETEDGTQSEIRWIVMRDELEVDGDINAFGCRMGVEYTLYSFTGGMRGGKAVEK